jgi:hypothetical protein
MGKIHPTYPGGSTIVRCTPTPSAKREAKDVDVATQVRLNVLRGVARLVREGEFKVTDKARKPNAGSMRTPTKRRRHGTSGRP